VESESLEVSVAELLRYLEGSLQVLPCLAGVAPSIRG
jgi:hypothetical protein